jgi:hypothetical protein
LRLSDDDLALDVDDALLAALALLMVDSTFCWSAARWHFPLLGLDAALVEQARSFQSEAQGGVAAKRQLKSSFLATQAAAVDAAGMVASSMCSSVSGSDSDELG